MDYIIKRIDYNTVKAEVEGCYPLMGTFEGFFKDLRSYINRYAFVKDVTYKNHTIFMEKRDPFYGYLYRDSYVLDGLLESDARFMEYLQDFLTEYEMIREQRRAEIAKATEEQNFNVESLRTGIRIFKNYCETGELEEISDERVAVKVKELFSKQSPLVYTQVSTNLDGDITTRPQVEFKTKQLNHLRTATGVSGVATAALALTTLAIPNPITLVSCIATGIGCYCTSVKKKNLNEEEAKKVLEELALKYEELYPSFPGEEGPKLVK